MLDMGVGADKPSAVGGSSQNDACRIYVPGIGAESFPFLCKQPEALKYLSDIIRLELKGFEPISGLSHLAAQVEPMKTVGDEHMLWYLKPSKTKNTTRTTM